LAVMINRHSSPSANPATKTSAIRQKAPAPVVSDEVKQQSAAPAPDTPFVPAFFPTARIVARVTEPADARGRHRELETVETGMRERYVRVVRTVRIEPGGKRRISGEIAMVADQLMLEKPAFMDGSAFTKLLRKAGAIRIAALNEDAYLATFDAH